VKAIVSVMERDKKQNLRLYVGMEKQPNRQGKGRGPDHRKYPRGKAGGSVQKMKFLNCFIIVWFNRPCCPFRNNFKRVVFTHFLQITNMVLTFRYYGMNLFQNWSFGTAAYNYFSFQGAFL
jgi:hypothetical protein